MELSDIRKSISEMSDEECRAELARIRTNRRISKRPPVAAKKAPSATAESSISTEALLNNATPDMAAKMLAMLQSKMKG